MEYSIFSKIGSEISNLRNEYRNFHNFTEKEAINEFQKIDQEYIPFLLPGVWVNGLGYLRSLGRKGYKSLVFDSSGQDISLYSKYSIPFKFEISNEKTTKYENLFHLAIKLGGAAKKMGKKPVLFIIAAERLLPDVVNKYYSELSDIFIFTADYKKQLQLEDKYAQIENAIDAGIDTPFSIKIKSTEEIAKYKNNLIFPLLVKANKGKDFYDEFGTQAFRAKNYKELVEIVRRVGKYELLVQEEVPGAIEDLKTLGSYFGRNHQPHGIFTGHKIRISRDYGTCSLGISSKNDEVIEKGTAFLKSVNYFGASQVEFMRDARNGNLKFIEINNRLWKWHSLAIESGVDLPYIQFRDAIGEPILEAPTQIDGIKWWLMLMDLSNAVKQAVNGQMRFSDYLKYIDLDFVDGIFAWDDPLPGLVNFFNGKWI